MGIVRLRSLWYGISGLLVAASIFVIILYGFNFGIDFTGGTLLQMHYTSTRPTVAEIETQLQPLNLSELHIEPANTDSVIIRTSFIQDDQRVAILQALGETAVEDSFETIGPTIGEELRQKAISAVIMVILAIVIYIAWAFRGVSKGPVPSWAFGLSTILALVHDIIIPLGVFVVLGEWLGVELNVMFITALLTILGFSVHDTIVVFDRIRENLRRSGGSFAEVIGQSIQQTFMRSLNTSVTVLIVLAVLLLFGGESIRYFVLALMIGITVGTYSSIFIASPSLLIWQKLLKKG
ncbi:MAG: protein-export membrane protein SecF [uncultured bacterium]|nr:MAG: protein-export membrane protein SecF [uncultured bacterium]HBY74037.1 protein translocase subunit SecF [Candidatus Kerfeldbacteria bacterium]